MTGRHASAIEIGLATDAPLAPTPALLERLLHFALAAEGLAGAGSLSLAIVDDATIQALHARHLGLDEPTDILTFDLRTDDAGGPTGPDPVLGEIILSYDTASAQAAEGHHGVTRELCFLALHGVLHLSGWNDASAAERTAMLQRQSDLLAQFESSAGAIQ